MLHHPVCLIHLSLCTYVLFRVSWIIADRLYIYIYIYPFVSPFASPKLHPYFAVSRNLYQATPIAIREEGLPPSRTHNTQGAVYLVVTPFRERTRRTIFVVSTGEIAGGGYYRVVCMPTATITICAEHEKCSADDDDTLRALPLPQLVYLFPCPSPLMILHWAQFLAATASLKRCSVMQQLPRQELFCVSFSSISSSRGYSACFTHVR